MYRADMCNKVLMYRRYMVARDIFGNLKLIVFSDQPSLEIGAVPLREKDDYLWRGTRQIVH